MNPVMESAVHTDFVSDITDNGHKTVIAVRLMILSTQSSK